MIKKKNMTVYETESGKIFEKEKDAIKQEEIEQENKKLLTYAQYIKNYCKSIPSCEKCILKKICSNRVDKAPVIWSLCSND